MLLNIATFSRSCVQSSLITFTISLSFFIKLINYIDHVERKVLKYENHKLRERKVKTHTRN